MYIIHQIVKTVSDIRHSKNSKFSWSKLRCYSLVDTLLIFKSHPPCATACCAAIAAALPLFLLSSNRFVEKVDSVIFA